MDLSALGRQVEADLDWREAELAVFREMLSKRDDRQIRHRAVFRAAWALLYAHYEGFAKFCLDLYLEFICRKLVDCRSIPDRLFVFLIDSEICKAKSLPAEDIFEFFTHEVASLRDKAPQLARIDTQSNLWPDLLERILARLDLSSYGIIEEKIKLKTLVARRNDIAHGKKVFIEDLEYYAGYETAALNVMYALALAVVDRASRFDLPVDQL